MAHLRLALKTLAITIGVIGALLALERLLFGAVVWALRFPYPSEPVYFADAVVVCAVINVFATITLGPILYAMWVTDSFPPGRSGWAQRLRRWARALIYGAWGTLSGIALGFVVGLIAGFSDGSRGSSQHNYPGVGALIVAIGAIAIGAFAGAPAGFIVGLVRLSRGSRLKDANRDRGNDLA